MRDGGASLRKTYKNKPNDELGFKLKSREVVGYLDNTINEASSIIAWLKIHKDEPFIKEVLDVFNKDFEGIYKQFSLEYSVGFDYYIKLNSKRNICVPELNKCIESITFSVQMLLNKLRDINNNYYGGYYEASKKYYLLLHNLDVLSVVIQAYDVHGWTFDDACSDDVNNPKFNY